MVVYLDLLGLPSAAMLGIVAFWVFVKTSDYFVPVLIKYALDIFLVL